MIINYLELCASVHVQFGNDIMIISQIVLKFVQIWEMCSNLKVPSLISYCIEFAYGTIVAMNLKLA